MAKTWPSHGPSNWFFLNHNQCAKGGSMPNSTILGVFHSPLFLQMAKIWFFYDQNVVLTCSVPNIKLLGVSCSQISLKWQKYGPFIAKTWSSPGPSTWSFLNHNQCFQGWFMINLTILGVSHSPLFLKMAKI